MIGNGYCRYWCISILTVVVYVWRVAGSLSRDPLKVTISSVPDDSTSFMNHVCEGNDIHSDYTTCRVTELLPEQMYRMLDQIILAWEKQNTPSLPPL